MKLSVVATILATCSSALASPVHNIFKRETYALSNGTAWNTSNHTNGTGSVGPDGTELGTKLKVFVTGGYVPIQSNSSNSSEWANVEFETLFNASSTLNVTQLYSVASSVNETLADDVYSGVVIVSNKRSVESLSFFSTIVLDTNKTVIVTEDALSGVLVAKDYGSQFRSTLTVEKKTGLIYSGLFAPAEPNAASAPVGILANEEVKWFFEPAVPFLVSPQSAIRTNYTYFTSTDVDYSPVVPIVYDGDYSQDLIDSLSDSLDGLVVVTSGFATNSSSSTLSSDLLPIVYAESSSEIGFVGQEDVPSEAIAAGYLSPVKAQLLVAIAAANGVSDPSEVVDLFP